VNLVEKFKRWWAPGEYDNELPPSEGEGHPLLEEERAEALKLSVTTKRPNAKG
jgi:hypothetical protein